MKEMSLSKKIGFGWAEFTGSVSALNTYAEIKDFFGQKGIGLEYPALGDKVRFARPGLGEICIEHTGDKVYQVTLLRGKIASRVAGWLGKYN